MEWTNEQEQVITLRNRNILVSAAAGSGKTAVLVERIIGRILEEAHPADIDAMLIVTFTSAAAAEMRERIGAAIEAALALDPSNSHLIRQATLVHHAQITTIHSFCLSLIRDYFHQVDLEPNFRIAEEGELNLLREDVMAEVLNRNYEAAEEEFLQFVECFAAGKNDKGLAEMALSLYRFAMSYPWPKEWLREAAGQYQFSDFEELLKRPWMESLRRYLRRMFLCLHEMARENVRLTELTDGPAYLCKTAEADAEAVLLLAEAKSYQEMARAIGALTFGRLPSKRGHEGSEELLEQFKGRREKMKDTVKKIKADFFSVGEKEIMERLAGMAPAAKTLARLTEEFMDAFDAKKREKNILDFNDLEHFALKILIQEDTKEPTEAARQCRTRFVEVMVDEYQDSNLVQESIVRAVSGEDDGRNNRFMVGDVKQSIYRFRLARPDLFMEKYDAYTTKESACQKVELSKNFRSRKETLDFTNHIFYHIMKKDLGNVEYDEAAALYPGAAYEECDGMEAEILLADTAEELLCDAGLSDPVRLEAELVASRIRRLVRSQQVTDKKSGALRAARYSDIVILLRGFGKHADVFQEVFERKGIPAHASQRTGYFQALEVQTALSLLRILDNPRQDIPLAAVMRSPIGGFSDEELALLKAEGQGRPFHCCVLEPEGEGPSGELSLKLEEFAAKIDAYRDLAAELPVHELLCRLLEETGYARYVAALPAGERRRANLEMLLEKACAYEKTSYRGLFHFIRYMEKLQKYEVDYGEAETVSENANAVRIMTIHKSKGLEFPIVFLCGAAKQFNRTDARSRMAIHPDLGIAFDFIDPLRRVRCATLYKKAVAKQIELENLGEELRILYVALTRAKEKLVITGVTKEIGEKVEAFRRSGRPGEAVPFLDRAKANSFLDLLLGAAFAGGEEGKIQIVGLGDLILEETESQWEETEGLGLLLSQVGVLDEKADAYVKERLSYQYPALSDTTRKVKYSVSELKHRAIASVFEEEEQLELPFPQEEVIPYVPRFAGGEDSLNQGALRGSAMHRAVECLPVERLAQSGSLERDLEAWLFRLVEEGRLSQETHALLRKDKLARFYQSKLAARMKAAKERDELYLERPFVMGRAADEIEGTGSGTMVLIQGVIDAFFLEDGEIVLVDYKTDMVRKEAELILRYERQLALYQQALECNLGRKVKEKLIYSFSLDKTVVL